VRKHAAGTSLWLMTRTRGACAALALAASIIGLAGCGSGDSEKVFTVPSPSMEPTFVKGDEITVGTGSAKLSRGVIIVLEDPGGWLPGPGGQLVKRVIGLGGDSVECDPAKHDGQMLVNGYALNEKAYLPDGTVPCSEPFSVKIPNGYLWLEGDNRGDSADSRAHLFDPGRGFVAAKFVVGVVDHIIAPEKRARSITTPSTFKDVPSA
jgi:signal peptidase I